MPDQPFNPDADLVELLEAVANRDLTEDQLQRLSARLASEPAARAAYIRATALDAMIAHEFPAAEPRVSDGALQLPTGRQRANRGRWMLAVAAMLLVVILIGRSFWLERQDRPTPIAGTGPSRVAGTEDDDKLPIAQIATITNLSDSPEFRLGQRLSSGPIDLGKGRLQITFDCGAVVTVAGPARFQLESEYRGFLQHGSLSALVPQEAEGFIIQTPTSHVRDLGTAFEVNVAGDGVTDLYVFQGAVEATPVGVPNARPTLLREGGAQRFSTTAVEPLSFDDRHRGDELSVTKRDRPPQSVHWSFDAIAGNAAADDAGQFPMRLLRKGSDPSEQSRDAVGMFGSALNFDGHGDYAESEYPGIAGFGARTVAFWVRLPTTDENGRPNIIVSWGVPEATKKWEIGWNMTPHGGVIGALRVDFGAGYVVGRTDLRDGIWHHVAAVFHGGSSADVSTHVKIYVDGRLETPTGRRQQAILTDIESPRAQPVTLGRYIGLRSRKLDYYFKGQIDELYIFDDALTPAEIAALRDTNALPTD